jgi:hypothetical protein
MQLKLNRRSGVTTASTFLLEGDFIVITIVAFLVSIPLLSMSMLTLDCAKVTIGDRVPLIA